MANILSAPATLANAVWAQDKSNTFLRNATLAIAGSLLIWLSAKIQIPLQPVPMTLQTLAILTIGAAYGWRLGMVTVALYLAEGAAGLPVFAGPVAGYIYMLGGTGGYLVGFLLASGVVGWLAERGFDRNILTTALAMLAGNVVIHGFGVAWLQSFTGWEKAAMLGSAPFLYGDMIKLALAAAILPGTWFVVNKIKGWNKS